MIDKFVGKHRFLSNFWEATIVFEDQEYPSSEHLFQALKTLDPKEREWVRISATPGEAKKRGRKVTQREDWEEVKDSVMKMVLTLKFSQHPVLKQRLLDTGTEELVEGNTWGDTYWGVCFGNGQNKLGKLLQELRAEMAEIPSAKTVTP